MTLSLTLFEWLRYSQQISEKFQKCDYKISSLNGLSFREKLKKKKHFCYDHELVFPSWDLSVLFLCSVQMSISFFEQIIAYQPMDLQPCKTSTCSDRNSLRIFLECNMIQSESIQRREFEDESRNYTLKQTLFSNFNRKYDVKQLSNFPFGSNIKDC